jgi:hypothetical protein
MAAMLKYLRIAVTALSLTACVLLIAQWVRSYWWVEQVFVPKTASKYVSVGSMPSVFAFGLDDKARYAPLGKASMPTKVSMPTTDWLAYVSEATGTPWSGIMRFSVSVNGFMMPCWFGVLLSVAISTTRVARRKKFDDRNSKAKIRLRSRLKFLSLTITNSQ